MDAVDDLKQTISQIRSRPIVTSSHCFLEKNDIIGNYHVGESLGKGRTSTVWAAKRRADDKPVAIKVYRSGFDDDKYYANEIKIFNKLLDFSAKNRTTHNNIIGYLGTFAHIAIMHDFRPRIHPCVVFDKGGDSLSKLLKYCKKNYDNGIPIHIVKKIMRGVLSGLKCLHECNIIHTDIKPSNILLNSYVSDLDENNLSVYIADLGSSTVADDLFSDHVGTTQYIAPEIIIEMPYSTPMDIWAALTMCYELITNDLLFDVYDECEVNYGEDVDGEALDGLECSEDDMWDVDPDHEELDGYSSDSSGDEDFDIEKINYRHLLLIAKVIGYPPNEFARNGRIYYNRHDRLKNNPDVHPTSVKELLYANYNVKYIGIRPRVEIP